MFAFFQRHLFWKLFVAYVLVIFVSLLLIFSSIFAAAPFLYDRFIAAGVAALVDATVNSDELPAQEDDQRRPPVERVDDDGNPIVRDGDPRRPGIQPPPPRNPELFAGFQTALAVSFVSAIVISLLASGIASWVLARRIASPLSAMQQASSRIASGEYGQRVPEPRGKHPDELGRLAVSFNQMASDLEQTEATRRELLANVAHELRTPLTTIKGTMEALMDDVLPASDDTWLQVYREADRLQHLVHDLQELSRVEAGAFELERHPMAVPDLLNAATGRLDLQYRDKNVALTTDLPAELPPVSVDEHRIGQVLLNLLGNALQYTPAGGEVTVTARTQGREVLIEVADNGYGIPASDLKHIFDRFYRVDKSRSRAGGGSGIGLTIARRLVEAHGGRIWAASPGPGQGSTFSFTLPAA